MDDMEKVMTELYRTTYGKDNAKRDDIEAESGEVILANPGWKKKKFQKNGDNKFGKDQSNITCYNCGKKGHFSNKC